MFYDRQILSEGISDNIKKAKESKEKYSSVIKDAHINIENKDYSEQEFPNVLKKELKINKQYGHGAYLLNVYDYGIKTQVYYTMFGLKGNDLVMYYCPTNAITGNKVRYHAMLKPTIRLQLICTKNKQNKIIFDVLEKCSNLTIQSIRTNDKSATIAFLKSSKSEVGNICDKFDDRVSIKSTLGNNSIKINLTDKVNESVNDLFDFELL